MIVRVANEGQYELKDSALRKLDEIDNALLDAVERGDAKSFRETLEAVLIVIRGEGQKLPDTDLRESALILPPPDITLDEARDLFREYPRELVEA